MNTLTEENYLKSLYSLSLENEEITVKEIAGRLDIKMPTVTSMIGKLADKKLVRYEKYKAIELTDKGMKQALLILRKHRLTELFLSQIMNLGWEEVHDIAEQIEHIQSERFFTRVDEMLGFPKFDPHGEPIPDASGKLPVYKFCRCPMQLRAKKIQNFGCDEPGNQFSQISERHWFGDWFGSRD